MNSSALDALQMDGFRSYFEAKRAGEQPDRSLQRCRGTRRLPDHFDDSSLCALTDETFANSRFKQVYEFEGLLVSILSGFVNLPTEGLDHEISRAQGRVGVFLGLDRVGFWHASAADRDEFQLIHQWVAQHQTAMLEILTENPVADRNLTGQNPTNRIPVGTTFKSCFPWMTEQTKQGRITMFSALDELPVEATQDKESLQRFGTRSSVVVPLVVKNNTLGAVSFDMLWSERVWPQLLLRRLELLAEIFADVTARTVDEQTTRAAVREVADLGMALDAHAIVEVTDLQGKITSANDKFCAISKYSREELLGQDHLMMNSGYHSKEFFAEMWSTIERGAVWQGEIKNRAKDGSDYWVATTIVPFLDERSKPRRYVAIRADITERKVAEEALTKSYDEIKRLKDRLQAEAEYLKTEIKVSHAHCKVIGHSKAVKEVLHQVEQVAPADCAVLINGETGTGKELIAQEIHRLSSRSDRLMVLVNCAALPSALVESELFGRERGAYTGALTSQVGRFEVANGSTIFLDEVGELSTEVQAKLLRVLQEGEFQRLGSPKTHKVNVRVIAATNRDLAADVRKGKFREDLYYRLRVFPIEIPPLRQRIEDIPSLVFAFLEEFASRMGKKITKVPRNAMEALQKHSWPGNIRELRNVIEHSVILSSGDMLKLSFLGDAPVRDMQVVTLAEAEREHILKTLESTGWRIKGPHGAAQRLDLQPSTLYSRMQKLCIPHRRQKDEMPTGI